jgi:hypothetical protein
LKNCQAMVNDMTLVLPLPVAIFTQYGAAPTSKPRW